MEMILSAGNNVTRLHFRRSARSDENNWGGLFRIRIMYSNQQLKTFAQLCSSDIPS